MQAGAVEGGDVFVFNEDLSPGRTFEQIQGADQRAFTGTRASDDAEYLTAFDSQIDIRKGKRPS